MHMATCVEQVRTEGEVDFTGRAVSGELDVGADALHQRAAFVLEDQSGRFDFQLPDDKSTDGQPGNQSAEDQGSFAILAKGFGFAVVAKHLNDSFWLVRSKLAKLANSQSETFQKWMQGDESRQAFRSGMHLFANCCRLNEHIESDAESQYGRYL